MSGATEYSDLLEEKDGFEKEVKTQKFLMNVDRQKIEKLEGSIAHKDKEIVDFQKLLQSFHSDPSFKHDYLKVLSEAREMWLKEWLLQKDGVVLQVSLKSKEYKSKKSEIERRTDIIELISESRNLHDLYLHDQKHGEKDEEDEEKKKSEKLEAELEKLKADSMLISDHRVAMDDLRDELTKEEDDTDEKRLFLKMGEQALTVARNKAILAYTYYVSTLDDISKHQILSIMTRIKETSCIVSLAEQANGYWALAKKEECASTYQESLVMEDEQSRHLYLTHAIYG